jgi:diadenylate cyclase
MEETFKTIFTNYSWLSDTIDIIFVSVIVYWILLLIKGTRAVSMLLGLIIVILAYEISKIINLVTLNWILNNFFGSLLIIVVIIFQNDIRRALAQLGKSPFLAPPLSFEKVQDLEELIRTVVSLANKKIGALLVLERNANIEEYVEKGIPLNADISKELITSIFIPVSPIHDGAILIQKGRISQAGCFLPLTINPNISPTMGTRHRAAIGVTEETDAIVLVVSEERGTISIAQGGELISNLDPASLRRILQKYFTERTNLFEKFFAKFKNMLSKTS